MSVVASSASSERQASPDTAYWVAFRAVNGVGPVRMQRLLTAFDTLEAAWHADASRLRRVLDERVVHQVVAQRIRADPQAELERLLNEGTVVVTLQDAEYPSLLREIPSPPPVLFMKGALVESDRRAVAIVGTRRVTPYGREMARTIARDLAQAGVTIVSGLARGVDGIAHSAALDAGGRTIALMGSGVRRIYPHEHRGLAERIVEQGALISDFLPDTPPDGPNFPARNRLISGMALGVIVIEAPDRSGALITVDFAADQGRDVFALPGSVLSEASTGCHRILRDGARLIRSAEDVLDDLRLGDAPRQTAMDPSVFLDDQSRRVLAALTGEPRHIDDIAATADIDITALSSMLMALELQGMVRNVGAQFYAKSG